MFRFKLFILVAACGMLAACASPNYYPHESRNNVQIGKGGARFVAAGMDVWFIGEPDRKYAILGYIEDPLNGIVDDDHRKVASSILQKAREVGADALIEVVTQTQTDSSLATGGMFGDHRRGVGLGIGFGLPLSERRSARYTAIKYLE